MRFLLVPSALLALVVFQEAQIPKAIVEWLRETKKSAVTLDRIVAAKSDDAARVFVIGRAFSGTSQIGRFEGALARCATAGDVIAIDIGFRDGEALDRWVRTGSGDIDKALADCGAYGWNPAETRAWLAELAGRESKPRIVGIATGDPMRACSEVLAYLGKMSPESILRAERALRALSMPGRNGEPRYMQLDDNERVVLRLGLEDTLGLFRDSEEAFTAKSSAAEFGRHLRLLVELQQYEEQMRFERDGAEHDPRGRCLAQNAITELSHVSEKGRMFVFVGLRDLARVSDLDSFTAQFEALRGGRCVAIATAAGSSEFRAFDPNPGAMGKPRDLKTSAAEATPLERAFVEAGGETEWILDLRVKPTDASTLAWLAASRSVRSARPICGAISEIPWDHDVIGDFDMIAWFKELTRSR